MSVVPHDFRAQLQASLGEGYIVGRELGGGGMSRVFLAEDVRLGRQVVTKVLSPDLGAGVSVDRFEREIRLAARLQHPHIVPLLAAGDVDGLPYFTMPFVAGSSLRERLNAGPLPTHEAQGILRDVAKALAYAHKQGIVHRDIKPENVLLSEGTAMVADFGVARAIREATTVVGAETAITQAGMQIGTPAYMAPEQAAGDPDVDFRADLYAFGVMAYELLAGQHPFAARKTAHALVVAHMTEEPKALATHTTTVAPSMASMVMQCLDKDPAERPRSASDIVAALEGAGVTPMVMPKPARAGATIAVLPFTNMSGDPANEYFSDGIADEITSALTQVKDLRVAARTSAFAYKGKSDDLATIGHALGVATVLQGSVRRAGNKVRVTAQLVNTHDGFQRWSERFDRDMDDIFAIQDEIARTIVEKLELTLGLKAQSIVARPTDDLEAYELYLRGREAIQQRTPPSMRRALGFFEQAVARDKFFARAHLGVAEAYIALGVYDAMPALDARAKAEAAMAIAVSLDSHLPGLSLLRGQLRLYLTSDWPSSAVDFAEALREDPNSALAHAYLALCHGLLRQKVSAIQSATRAIECDPLSPLIRGLCGLSRNLIGEYEEAIRLYDEGLALDPTSVLCLYASGISFARLGRLEAALERFVQSVELSRRSALLVSLEVRALMWLGRDDEARVLLAELRERSATEYIGPPVWLGPALAGGSDEDIEAALRHAIDAGTGPATISMSMDLELEALMDHPRLGPLVRQLPLYVQNPRFANATTG